MKLSFNYWSFTLLIASLIVFSNEDLKSQSNNGENKTYRVTAYKIGGSGISSLSNTAEAIPKPLLYIPSAFTPNGDGLNDSFGVKAEGIKSFNLQIYNRIGELVFESDDIQNYWDGSYKGKKITSTDVYVYQVKAIGKNNSVLPEQTGRVTLVADGTLE
jgi:gliding motility-associated-like protein